MADYQLRRYLICYDIADPKRLSRVHRLLSRYAVPVQYSVFTARLNKPDLMKLLAEVQKRINPREDDVRAYTLPERCEATAMGVQFFPEGVMLLDEGRDLLRLAKGS